MVLTEEQLQKVRLLSDIELYDQAEKFMTQFGRTIPTSQMNQVNGLVNITKAGAYADVIKFVRHQQGRTWPDRSKYMKSFYARLAEELEKVAALAVKEFHLQVSVQLGGTFQNEAVDELMLLLVREFIQHLAAQNGYLDAKRSMGKRQYEYGSRGNTRK